MSKFGESGYVKNIEKYAKQATKRPDDFGYWGSDDMFNTWGFTNIDQNRDSDVLERANFKYITEELMAIFPDDYRIETYNHWAVGSVDRLVCRVYEEDTDKKVIFISNIEIPIKEILFNIGENIISIISPPLNEHKCIEIVFNDEIPTKLEVLSINGEIINEELDEVLDGDYWRFNKIESV